MLDSFQLTLQYHSLLYLALCSGRLIFMDSLNGLPFLLTFCWMQSHHEHWHEIWEWGHHVYFLSSFLVPPFFLPPYFGCVSLLKAMLPVSHVWLELPLQFRWSSGSVYLTPSSLGGCSPFVAKHKALHHLLLVFLNCSHTFTNSSLLLLNSPQLFHGSQSRVSLLRLGATFFLMWGNFFPIRPSLKS